MFHIVHTSLNLSIVFSVHCFLSGLVESSGSSEWELLSIVNNKQRGSQRMIEKLRYTVEHKQQSISKAESELRSTICIVTVLILYYACVSTV